MRLQVTVEDTMRMTELDSIKNLVDIALCVSTCIHAECNHTIVHQNDVRLQSGSFKDSIANEKFLSYLDVFVRYTSGGTTIHELLQIIVKIFKHQK